MFDFPEQAEVRRPKCFFVSTAVSGVREAATAAVPRRDGQGLSDPQRGDGFQAVKRLTRKKIGCQPARTRILPTKLEFNSTIKAGI